MTVCPHEPSNILLGPCWDVALGMHFRLDGMKR